VFYSGEGLLLLLISFSEINCFVIVVSEYNLYISERSIGRLYGSEHLPLGSRLEPEDCDKYESLLKDSNIEISQLRTRCGLLTYFDGVTRGSHLQRSQIYHIL
jgi:hypothetical protein